MKKLTRILRVAIPMLVLLAAIGAATADTHFVWSSGSDGNGLSWATAKHAIAAAITDASSGDEIWVAADTYTENITLKAGVALYGGFSGSENTLGDRNWRTNVTIIDGNQNGSVVTVPTGVTSTTIIDGFTIQNGNGTVVGSARVGGGIYCNGGSPTVSANIIKGNSVSHGTSAKGAGVYLYQSTARLENNFIWNNTVTGTSNGAVSGGGLYCEDTGTSGPLIVNNTIAANKITGSGTLNGGGVYVAQPVATFINNAIWGQGFGDLCNGGNSPTLTNNLIGAYTNAQCQCLTLPATNKSGDPQFVNMSGGNLRLLPTSPCVNAAANASAPAIDMDGQPRKSEANANPNADIGADECYQVNPPRFNRVSGEYYMGSGLHGLMAITDSGTEVRYEPIDPHSTSAQQLDTNQNGVLETSELPTVDRQTSALFPTTSVRVCGSLIMAARSFPTDTNSIWEASEPVRAEYRFNAKAPTFVPNGGTMISDNLVVVTTGIQCLSTNPGPWAPQDGFTGLSTSASDLDTREEALDLDAYYTGPISLSVGTTTLYARVFGNNCITGTPGYAWEPGDMATATFTRKAGKYIKPGGTGDGSSWTNAGGNIQAAINSLTATGGEVWVQYGSYSEHIALRAGVSVYGGFEGTELYREERDPKANVTTIDCSSQGSFSVVTASDGAITNATVIDGFTITGGNASYGGGIICTYGASPTISGNIITDNYAGCGAGIYSEGNPTIIGNVIESNTADILGGGIYAFCVEGGITTIRGNVIRDNDTYESCGGMYVASFYALFDVSNNVIVGNSAPYYAGGIGGDLGMSGSKITNNTIANNTAGDSGGGICCFGSGTDECEIANNIVAFNSDGILANNCTLNLSTNCVYSNGTNNYIGLTPTSDIQVDPTFANSSAGDFRLRSGSQCIDAGTNNPTGGIPSTDIDGRPRVVKGTQPFTVDTAGIHVDCAAIVDIGAYEDADVLVEDVYVEGSTTNRPTVPHEMFGSNLINSDMSRTLTETSGDTIAATSFLPDFMSLVNPTSGELGLKPGILRLWTTSNWRNCVGADRAYEFGLSQFAKFMQESEAQSAVMMLDLAATAQEDANFMEFCNGLVPTSPNPAWTITSYAGDATNAPFGYFAWLRSQLTGSTDPFDYIYWEIGNEPFWTWGQGSAVSYGNYCATVIPVLRAKAAAINTDRVSRSESTVGIKIGVAAWNDIASTAWGTTRRDYDVNVLAQIVSAGQSIDFIAPHYYSALTTAGLHNLGWYSTSTTAMERHITLPDTGSQQAAYTFRVIAKMDIFSDPREDDGMHKPTLQIIIDNDQSKAKLWDDDDIGYGYREYTYTVNLGPSGQSNQHTVKLNLGNMMYFPPYGGNGLSIQRVTVSSSSMQETSIWLPDSAELVGVLSDDHIISERISDLRDQLDTAGFTNCVILPTEGSFHSGDQEYSLNHTREVPQSLRLKGAFWMSAVLNSLTRDIEDKKVEGFCHHTLYDWGLWGAITLWPFYSGDSWHASPANHALSMYSALGGSTLLEVSDPPSTPLDYPEELPAPPIDNAWTAKSVMLGYGTPDTPKCVDVLATRTTGNTVFIVLSNRSGKTADTAVHISDYLQASQVTATAQVLSVQGFGNRTPALTDGLVKELETSNIGDYMEHPVVPDTVAISDGSVMLGTDGQSNTVVTCPLKPYSITLIKLVPEP